MKQFPKEKYFMPHIISQDEDDSRWAKNQSKGMRKEGYSQLDDDDETDTQNEGGFSVVSIGEHSEVPVKAASSKSAKSKRLFGARRSRSPITFAPRSPKNFRRFVRRRSPSADSDLFRRLHSDGNDNSFPSPQPPSQQSIFVFHSSKDPSKADLLSQSLATITRAASHHSESTTDTYQTSFSSPFASSQKLAPFCPFDISDNASVKKQHQTDRRIRKISYGDVYEPISNDNHRRRNSLDLIDVFPSDFEDAYRPSNSMPRLHGPHHAFHPSPTSMGTSHVGNKLLGSSFAKAMELDPFEDDCVEFSSGHRGDIEMPIKVGSRAEHLRFSTIKGAEMSESDFATQLKVMQAEHEIAINERRSEIETSNEIIKALTKQVQDLMSRNEELSRQQSKQPKRASKFKKKEPKHSIHRMAHGIDMLGHVIESSPENPSLQTDYVTVEASEIKVTDLSDEVMEEKLKSSNKRKKSSKKGLDLDLDPVVSTSTEEEEVEVSRGAKLKSKKSKRYSTADKTQKRRKSKRSSKLSPTSGQSEPTNNEHLLSMCKRQISAELMSKKRISPSISESSEPSKEGKNSKKSGQKLSEEIGDIWLFEWNDPSTPDRKRGSNERKHSSKNLQKLKGKLEASVGKLPKRKAKCNSPRRSTKSEIEIITDPRIEDSSPKKAKRSSRKSSGVVLNSDSEKRKKAKKTKLLDLSKAEPDKAAQADTAAVL